jgi:PAS domain S-box-containing protein
MGHDWARPMQLALRGGSSSIESIDYQGDEVVAAYMYIESVDLGLVAKSPLKKIRSRFIIGAMMAIAPAVGIVLVGILFFVRVTSPVIHSLEIENALNKKNMEDKTKIKEEYESLISNVPGMIYRGEHDWSARIMSGAKLISGFNEEEINAREDHWLSVVHPEDREKVYDDAAILKSKDVNVVHEYRIIAKNGETRWVEDHKTALRGRGVGKEVIGILFDITERVKAKVELNRLHKYERQKSKMEAIGNFASGIAHDFNNALTPIVGNCDIMLHDLPDDAPCRKNILQILAASETATLLVHRMQSFARGNGSIDKLVPLRLPHCLEEAYDFLRSMTPSSIQMEMNIEPGIPIVSATDVTIRQILMNICKNSAQSMRGLGGKIRIDVSTDEILVERYGISKGKYVKIEVEDNGRGMTSDTLERALDPYFTTKKVGDGMGIGLSVVHGIIDRYDGFIRIYSEVDRGTRVVIYIPAIVEAEGAIVECSIDDPIPLGNGERILLVDDEDMIVSTGTSILESLNYVVTGFNSSVDALREFCKHPQKYDILVTDLTMPHMTGIILIREIKKIKPEIKIVLCSGLGSNGKYAYEVFGDSIGAYVTKPVTRRGYGNVLAKIINQRRSNDGQT